MVSFKKVANVLLNVCSSSLDNQRRAMRNFEKEVGDVSSEKKERIQEEYAKIDKAKDLVGRLKDKTNSD